MISSREVGEVEEMLSDDEKHPRQPTVSGAAAVALSASNEVRRTRVPQRVPRVRKMFRLNKKKPSRRLKPPKGKVIDGRHEQYAITYSMQLCIQRSVEYAMSALPDDFESACKETVVTHFPPAGSDVTPEHAMRQGFTVKDYAPCVFAKVRQAMGVSPDFYLESLCSGLSFIDFIANSRSRQFFFYSYDGVFMIKTLRTDEKNFLLKLLPSYVRHVEEDGTLLTRFYGLHCTRLKHLRRKVHFVVMASIFGANTSNVAKEIYDLKGSSHGREATQADLVKKDNDARKNGLKLRFGKERAQQIMDTLRFDAEFLARHHIMDYSLLVGVYFCVQQQRDTEEDHPHPQPATLSDFNSKHFARLPSSIVHHTSHHEDEAQFGSSSSHVVPESPSNAAAAARIEQPIDFAIEGIGEDGSMELYYLGIIDILQVYNARKIVESAANVIGPRRYKDCSCVSPNFYKDRFLDFLSSILL